MYARVANIDMFLGERIFMRIRPFFWCLLACVCIGTLAFAATYQSHSSNILHVHLVQSHLLSNKPAILEVSLTDTQGLPIESAHISSHARMTNMDMPTQQISTRSLGQGQYRVQMYLFMAGPWAIDLQAQAEGFLPSQQSLYVQVE